MNRANSIEKAQPETVDTEHGTVFVLHGGVGPPVLLLHGFPETHLMWRDIAPLLMREFTLVIADLPGYGRSSCPPASDDHFTMSKRALGSTLVEAMHRLGYQSFAVVGHDRGGRVAYRMALDYPAIVTRAAVLDVIPISEVWDRADSRLLLSFWPFSLLAQAPPFPERLISAAPDAVVSDALDHWGSASAAFPESVRNAYCDALRDEAHAHAICEEYRAAASIDRQHDAADITAGRRIGCPLLALWSATGGLATWYQEAGGPLGIWNRWAVNVSGQPVAGGHFFPEESPSETAALLSRFLRAS